MSILTQLKVLFIKQFILSKRNWKTSICQYLAPAILVLMLLVFQEVGESTPSFAIEEIFDSSLSRCFHPEADSCTTLLYTWAPSETEFYQFNLPSCTLEETLAITQNPALQLQFNCSISTPWPDAIRDNRVAAARSVMQRVAAQNDMTEGDFEGDDDVQFVPDFLTMRNYIVENPNRTMAATVFLGTFDELFRLLPPGQGIPTSLEMVRNISVNTNANLTDVPMTYAVLVNETNSFRSWNSLKRAIDEAALELDDARVTYQLGSYPVAFEWDAAASFGAILFYCAVMFNFTLTVYAIVAEREARLRIALTMVGLSDSVYWLHRFMDSLITLIISTLLMVLMGYATQLRFFADTSFLALFLSFFMFGLAMIPISFLLAIVISTSKSAFQAGMIIFVVGILVQSIVSGPFLLNLIHTPALFDGAEDMVLGLQFYPPFNFAKMMNDIGSGSPQNPIDEEDTGLSWDDASKPRSLFCQDDQPATADINTNCVRYISLADSALFQFYMFLLYGFIAWLLYNIHGNERGRPIYFIVTPAYWRALFGLKAVPLDCGGDPLPKGSTADVAEEYQRTMDAVDIPLANAGAHAPDEDDKAVAVRVMRLKKRYNDGMCDGLAFEAVKSLSVSIDEGQVFALLGHNGAGKTTAISIITGVFQSTAGDAFVYGLSSNYEPRAVQRIIGVCFQHDILWEQLTAGEHVRLFAELKGVPARLLDKAVKKHLEEVGLYKVKDKPAGQFSGGMKRRLSVAIASVGDPKMVILDEPTTGLDPVSKHAVWDSIRRLKQDRVVLLTTHSMEEADVLADRIGIMASGELKVIGTSLFLKNHYGAGYRINLACASEEEVPELKELAEKYIPGCVLIAESTSHLVYELPNEHVKSLVKFTKFIERDEPCVMTEYEISQSTLEEVFMKVSEHAKSTD